MSWPEGLANQWRGRRRPRRRGAAWALLLVLCGACDFYYYKLPSPDELWYVIPWFDHMIHARYIRPYETDRVPRYTPPGAVPVTGAEPDWSAEWVAGRTTTSDTLTNPLVTGRPARSPGPAVPLIPREVAAAGDSMYQTFCAVCHGTGGNADGTISGQIGAPSLLTPRARAYSDGYLYGIIRYGRGVMPRYGDKLPVPADRWAIVSHIRRLQAEGPVAPGPTAPVPPGPSATGSTAEVPQ